MVFEVRGVPKWSQNDPQNGAKIKLRCGGPTGEPPGAILEGLGGSKRLPRGAPGAPRAQHEPQEASDDPQEGQNEPQEGQSELREVPGGFRERFGEDFRSIFKQRVATETLPAQTAGEGA